MMPGAGTAEETLALNGGPPVRREGWPRWPRADEQTERMLKDVLYSDRWTISSPYTGRKPYERRFAEALAAYYGLPGCVPTTSGSTALTIALQALGAGPGREVLVPALSWVACAATVLGVGAVPVLVDVDPATLCMSAGAARRAISQRTAAILLVHQNCSIADLEAFLDLSRATGAPLLEDCSQAHGATWGRRRVGTVGKVAVCSMQENKLLTCGEGGAVLTADAELYDRLQQLRANGRMYRGQPPPIGQMELEEAGAVIGNNYVLSEFHAAILLDRLQHLDEENRVRAENASYLNRLLAGVGGLTPVCGGARGGRLTYHKYCVRVALADYGGADVRTLARALSAELNLTVSPLDDPLNRHRLLRSGLPDRILTARGEDDAAGGAAVELPVASRASRECLTFRHPALLGDKKDMEDIAAAFAKVKRNHHQLARHA